MPDVKRYVDNSSNSNTTDGKESKLVKDILGRQAEQEAVSKTTKDSDEVSSTVQFNSIMRIFIDLFVIYLCSLLLSLFVMHLLFFLFLN